MKVYRPPRYTSGVRNPPFTSEQLNAARYAKVNTRPEDIAAGIINSGTIGSGILADLKS